MKIPAKVEEKIRYLIRKFPRTEWSGILFTTHTGSFEDNNLEILCHDIYPMDLGTSGWTEFKMSEDVVAYMAENIELFDCDIQLLHSHHCMSSNFSGQDINTLQSEGADTNCFVSLIVNTAGTYSAAITRRVKQVMDVTTLDMGTTYEFFGEGTVTKDSSNSVSTKRIEKEVIEYFMLDVEVEQVDNHLDYLDRRFEEIEAKKKPALPFYTPYTTMDPKEYNKSNGIHTNLDWQPNAIHSTPKELPLFKEGEVETVEPELSQEDIHYAVCQLITCSLIISKDIDLKQWITRHMDRKYKEMFNGMEEFERWSDFYVEFILYHLADPIIEATDYDNDMIIGSIANDLYDDLRQYKDSNIYVNKYLELLQSYSI